MARIPNTRLISQELKKVEVLINAHKVVEEAFLRVGSYHLSRELQAILKVVKKVEERITWLDDDIENFLKSPDRCSDERCPSHGELLVYDDKSKSMICPHAVKMMRQERQENI